jgi:uncharacterized protein (DUF924 family)
MNEARAKAILDHFLGGEPRGFDRGPEEDGAVRERFAEDLAQARRGELDAWTSHKDTLLAFVLLLDQVSRHVHRGTKEAYASDAKAQATVLVSIARGLDGQLSPEQRAYFYLPLMHAEDPAVQERAVELYRELGFSSFIEAAERHREIVERFGRFPDRNALLGRDSTPEEQRFLGQP